jgi:peptide/nickel transport system permease protein
MQSAHPGSRAHNDASAPSISETPGPEPAAPIRRTVNPGRVKILLWAAPVLLFIAAAVFGPMLVEYNPVEVNLVARLEPPGTVLPGGTRAWLGTDQVGQDVLAQVLQGARISLLVGASTILLAGLIGLVTGVVAGFYGGWTDVVLMRLADIQLAFPSILLAILIAAVLGPSVVNVVLALALTRWVTFGRVARAATLAAKERDYVLAARSMGADSRRPSMRPVGWPMASTYGCSTAATTRAVISFAPIANDVCTDAITQSSRASSSSG